MSDEQNEEYSQPGKALKKPRVILRRSKEGLLKPPNAESRRVIPGRLDALYKKLGVKRLTPRKDPDFTSPTAARKSSCRNSKWVNSNSHPRSRRLSSSGSSRTKYLPTVPNFCGLKKRNRAERYSTSFLEKRKRIRSLSTKELIHSSWPKSKDSLKSDTTGKESVTTVDGATKKKDTEKPCIKVVDAAGECLTCKKEREEDESVRQLNVQVKQLTSKNEELTAQIKHLNSKNEVLKSENVTLQATIQSQKCTMESLKTTMTKQKNTMESMLESFSNVQSEHETKQSNYKELNQRCEMLEKKNSLLRLRLIEVEKSKTVTFTANELTTLNSLVEKIPDFSDLKIRLSK